MNFNQEEKELLKFSLQFLIEGLNITPSKKLKRKNLNKTLCINSCNELLKKFN